MQPDPKILKTLVDTGFAIIPGVITREEAHAMRPLLDRAIKEDIDRWGDRPGYVDHNMVHNLMVRGQPFLELLENPVLHAYFTPILGDTCILYAYTSSSMPPNGANMSRRVHVDCPRVIPDYVTNLGVTLALDDFSIENGATELMPYSQWRTDSPSEDEFNAKCAFALPKAGDAIIFNARTFHRGGTNTTAEARHAVTMNICRAFMKQRFDYPRLVSAEMAASLGEVGRRFLGFNVRIPTSLDEYYVPEEFRLYKAGQG